MGVRNVIVTLGVRGALVFDGEHCERIPAYEMQAVDTTAAGDIFNGAFVVALSEGRSLPGGGALRLQSLRDLRHACRSAKFRTLPYGSGYFQPIINNLTTRFLTMKTTFLTFVCVIALGGVACGSTPAGESFPGPGDASVPRSFSTRSAAAGPARLSAVRTAAPPSSASAVR